MCADTPVIPAKAGIQSVGRAFPLACGVDSRFRGNDFTGVRHCFANDTSTPERGAFTKGEGPDLARNPAPVWLNRSDPGLFALFLNGNQFDLKNESRVGADQRA